MSFLHSKTFEYWYKLSNTFVYFLEKSFLTKIFPTYFVKFLESVVK